MRSQQQPPRAQGQVGRQVPQAHKPSPANPLVPDTLLNSDSDLGTEAWNRYMYYPISPEAPGAAPIKTRSKAQKSRTLTQKEIHINHYNHMLQFRGVVVFLFVCLFSFPLSPNDFRSGQV